jgi:endonuclease/exonuclease/phosphatase family metal-dependent hydrolase
MPSSKKLVITSYNIHKGMSPLNLQISVSAARARMATLKPDILFLQEVQGALTRRGARFAEFPHQGQHEFFAELEGYTATYAVSRAYRAGHHGNAIISRHQVVKQGYMDISHHRLEGRTMLHTEIDVGKAFPRLHCVCVHLGLFARSRRAQLRWIVEALEERIPSDSPLILAGDFNDWRHEASDFLLSAAGLTEVFEHAHGKPARSFPAMLPVMSLDRIYTRGLIVKTAEVAHGPEWLALSDHAPLIATLALPVLPGRITLKRAPAHRKDA